MTQSRLALSMPPSAPLAHPQQDLSRRFRDHAAPVSAPDAGAVFWRLGTFLPAAIGTGVLLWGFLSWFAADGTSWAEALLAMLIGAGFFWIALTFVTVLAGSGALFSRMPPDEGPITPLDVALLVPVHEEAPWDVFGNAAAMLERLAAAPGAHRWSLYILSDTRDPVRAAQEETTYAAIRAGLPDVRVWYRRRVQNTDRKVGNLAQWVAQWGGAHDAMLVLDADSLMSAQAIRSLADAMGRDTSAGLIQSFPQLIGARSLLPAASNSRMPSTASPWPRGWPAGRDARAITGATTPSSAPQPLPRPPVCRMSGACADATA